MNDENLQNIFFEACSYGNLTSAEEMLSESDLRNLIDVRSVFWDEALKAACKFGQHKVVHLILLKGIFCFDDAYDWALSEASVNGHLDIMELMIDRGATDLNLALWKACLVGQYNSVVFLIKKDAVIDYDDEENGEDDFWFVELEKIQLRLLGDGISRSQLTNIRNITSLFTKLDQENALYKMEIFNVMPVCDLVFVCAEYICL